MGKGRRIKAKRATAKKRPLPETSELNNSQPSSVRVELPRPNVTTFTGISMIPRFPPGHPLGDVDLPPGGSPGNYIIDAVLGVPGASRSTFTEINWEAIADEGDSLIEVLGSATGITQTWHLGGPDGDRVVSYDFNLNANRRLATAKTQLVADSFRAALVAAQDVLESYLSAMSFHLDVPAEAVAWRVTEERTGAVHLAMKHLGKVKPIDLSLTMISSREFRELLAIWREAMNAITSMGQALGFYKIIERTHKYRVERESRTRGTDNHYLPPRELIPDKIESLIPDYEMSTEVFKPYLGKKFTSVWETDLRESIRNAVAHLREDAPSLTPDRAADVETCRQAVPVLHYMARTMLQCEMHDQEHWPNGGRSAEQ